MAIYKIKNTKDVFIIEQVNNDTFFQNDKYGEVLITKGNYAVMDVETGNIFQYGLTETDLNLYWKKVDNEQDIND